MNKNPKPVCCDCGGTDIGYECHVGWNEDLGALQIEEVCEKGHYCSDCDTETRLSWIDPNDTQQGEQP